MIAEGRAAYIVRQLLDAGFRMGAGAVLTIEGALARYFMSPKPVEDGSLEQRQMLGLYLSVLAGNGLCGREIALGSPHRWMLKLEREELVDLRAIFTALGDVPDFSITITGVETTSERISVTATRNGDGVVLGSPNFPVEALDELLEGLAVYVDGLANN